MNLKLIDSFPLLSFDSRRSEPVNRNTFSLSESIFKKKTWFVKFFFKYTFVHWNFIYFIIEYMLRSPDSSVGRAVDWRSSCHQFESGSGQFFLRQIALNLMKIKKFRSLLIEFDLSYSCRTISMFCNDQINKFKFSYWDW